MPTNQTKTQTPKRLPSLIFPYAANVNNLNDGRLTIFSPQSEHIKKVFIEWISQTLFFQQLLK